MEVNRDQKVRDLLDIWLPRLGLEDWIININTRLCYFNDGEDEECEASIQVDLKYHEADLEIYIPFWNNDTAHQEKNIVHELTHILLWRLDPHISPSGDDALEEVVQTIAMRFYNIYQEKAQAELTPSIGFHMEHDND